MVFVKNNSKNLAKNFVLENAKKEVFTCKLNTNELSAAAQPKNIDELATSNMLKISQKTK